jgi:hypothetical protein
MYARVVQIVMRATRGRRKIGIPRGVRATDAALGALALLLGCEQFERASRPAKADAAPPASRATAAAPPGSTSGLPAALAPPGASLPALPVHDIGAGDVTTGGPWLSAYRAGRAGTDAGLTWSAARAACQLRDMDLCTEPQWRRACSVDSEVGKVASWTPTVKNAAGFVVRGGNGCDSVAIVSGSQKDPSRVGLCCSRAIAIQTTNRNGGFLRSVSERLMSYERALNAHSVPAVGALLDSTMTLYAMTNIHKNVAESRFEGTFRRYPQETAVHGTCLVTLDLVGSAWRDRWIAECDKLIDRGSEVAVVTARYEFGGPKSKLRLVRDARIIRDWSAP